MGPLYDGPTKVIFSDFKKTNSSFAWLILPLAMDYFKQVVGWHLILLIQCHVLHIKDK
jgi:hypothetical protein